MNKQGGGKLSEAVYQRLSQNRLDSGTVAAEFRIYPALSQGRPQSFGGPEYTSRISQRLGHEEDEHKTAAIKTAIIVLVQSDTPSSAVVVMLQAQPL